jgi:hypothetical protein
VSFSEQLKKDKMVDRTMKSCSWLFLDKRIDYIKYMMKSNERSTKSLEDKMNNKDCLRLLNNEDFLSR